MFRVCKSQPHTESPSCETYGKEIFGGYCAGVPPLPIPNREVKPGCADGTAMQCGRVGGRLLLRRGVQSRNARDSFFVYLDLFISINNNFHLLFFCFIFLCYLCTHIHIIKCLYGKDYRSKY